ncbi:putative quinol monooxygenase [Methanoregula sp.]|uniref:putative quinol monooxygenase n=1 Tax=Methanoregula sp. TaxID=2052170 RepID=UPI003BB12DC2
MILVDARCTVLPERKGDFIRETQKIIPVVQREAGCTRYELLADVGDTGVFHFIEEWESRKHLDEHLAQPHMQEYLGKTAPWYSAPADLTLYDVLGSQSGTPGH